MTPASPFRLVLASASPRRAELLAERGIPFEVSPAPVDEDAIRHGDPSRLALDRAGAKARATASAHPEAWVLGADTVVVAADGGVLGQTVDREQAAAYLERLSGAEHRVITGVCLLRPRRFGDQGPRARDYRSGTVTSLVRFRPLDAGTVRDYLDTEEWRGKAGGYAVQGRGGVLVESLEGSYTNVVGLPMETVEAWLREAMLGT